MSGWLLSLGLAMTGMLLVVRMRRRLELLDRAAHELRSPLCAARLAVHAAARDAGGATVASIDRELARAAVALADLDAARHGREPSADPRLFEAAELLDAVAATQAALAWPLERVVVAHPPDRAVLVRGDEHRLGQALAILVGNALEHGAGVVHLRARSVAGRVRLEVSDDGPGLPAPIAQLVRTARRGRPGRGRGLAIASEIARRHGGRLTAAPSAGGARLVLELPALAVAADEAPHDLPARPPTDLVPS